MDQTEKLRATAIALFPEDTTEPEARAIVERLADEEDLAGFKAMLRKTILSDGSQRTYIKFSKVVPRNEFGSGWVVNITGKLFDAGYDDVAWRVTRLGPQTDDGESTTESFPAELFKEALGDEKDLP